MHLLSAFNSLEQMKNLFCKKHALCVDPNPIKQMSL